MPNNKILTLILADCDHTMAKRETTIVIALLPYDSIDAWHSNSKHIQSASRPAPIYTHDKAPRALCFSCRLSGSLLTHIAQQQYILSHIDYIIIIDYVYFIH